MSLIQGIALVVLGAASLVLVLAVERLRTLFSIFRRCAHRHTTWPFSSKRGCYIVCLDCAREIPYTRITFEGRCRPATLKVTEVDGELSAVALLETRRLS